MRALSGFLLLFSFPAFLASAPHAVPRAVPSHLAAPPSPSAAVAPASTPSSVVLQRYAAALARVSAPPALIFDYTVEQAGLHDIEQKHRIYRGKAIERDEMTEIDGRVLSAPLIRVMSVRDRYDILAIAPRSDRYVLTFVKAQRNEGHFDYVFRATSRAQAPFLVDTLTIDGQTFLPSVVTFHTSDDVTQASGRLLYGSVDGHWVIREASVSAAMGNKQVRERVLWTGYQFPPSLPASTFTQAREDKELLVEMRAGK